MWSDPRRRAWLAVLVLVGSVAHGRAAVAQEAPPPAPGVVALARDWFHRGLEASQREEWGAALEAFARAYALTPEPQVLFNLAAAQAQAGHPVAAAESYRRFLREVTSGPLAAHRDAAAEALAVVEQSAAHARVVVRGAAEGDGVRLDGQALTRAAWDAPLPVDPGAHTAALVRGGAEVARVAFALEPGDARQVVLIAPPATAPRGARRERAGSALASPWLWTGVGAAVVVATGLVLTFVLTAPPAGNLAPGRVEIP